MTLRTPAARGFTLIELMIVVAIIGILSSVAIPSFTRSQVRARVAERATVLEAMSRAINDTVSSSQKLPDPGSTTTWDGPSNPAGALTTYKRRFDYTLGGWKYMPMIIQGHCYYSYGFHATLADMYVTADGDLDGDGVASSKTITFTSKGFVYVYASQTPAAGQEDDASPSRTF
jgi:prepilin-type N-terminal cleavage/methylation domain-containing protein